MKKLILHALCLAFIAAGLLLSKFSYAQVPQKFNYQGIARDLKGNPLGKQTLALKLSVLPTEDATVAEYEETQIVATNEFGLYTLQIGNGTALIGNMKTIKWETGNKYIRVAIDPKGGNEYTVIGTSQLLSVPYAIYADKAGLARETVNQDGKTRTGVVNSNAAHVVGDVNFVSKFTALNEIGKSLIFDNGVRVGIGTTTPLTTGLLHLKSGIGTQPLILESPQGVHNLIQENGLNRGYFGSFIGSGGAFPTPAGTADADFDIGTSGANPTGKLHLATQTTPRLTILPTSGNVGIGTTSPTTKLEVVGQVKITGGTPGLGKVLTSDASGLATWETPTAGGSGVSSINGSTGVVTQSFSLGTTGNSPSVTGSGSNAVVLNLPIASGNNSGILSNADFTTFNNKFSGSLLTNRIPKSNGSTVLDQSMILDNGVSVGVNNFSPNASALLHLSSTNKGILIPQVSIDSLQDIISIPNPAQGLMVYNTVQPGLQNDMKLGYYYYSTNANKWIRFSDELNDETFINGGTLGVKLKDMADGVEMMDNFTGSSTNLNPKVKILKQVDSSLLNSKRNINALVLSGVNKKTTAGWDNRQKTSIIFENSYLLANGTTSGTQNSCAISSYTENKGTTASNLFNGLAFYTTTSPSNTSVADTPTVSMFRHNVMIGGFAADSNNVTTGRLQITGFSNGDQLSLRHPSNVILKWGLYVSSIDSSLNFYYNGSLRSNIDRVTGVYTALSDRRMKKDIVELSPVLKKLLNLKVYNYRYLDSKESDRKMNGIMAQDLLTDFPELVYQRYDRSIDKPLYTVDYSGLGVLAIKAIQEQQNQINSQSEKLESYDVLAKKIEALEEQNAMLLKRLEKLEKK